MAEYQVELRRFLRADDAFGSVCIQKKIALPFAPTPSISLGLHRWSVRGNDEDVVDHVLWNHARGVFIVTLGRNAWRYHGKDALFDRIRDYFVKNGWSVYLGEPAKSKESAMRTQQDLFEDGEPPLVIVESDGLFYLVDEIEAEAHQMIAGLQSVA